MPGTTSSDPRATDVDVARLLASGPSAAAVCTPPSEDESANAESNSDDETPTSDE
ncbi:hypothetical protein [Streptacidiphilus sp. MAP5-3]|jgi:hypothetical protein|uniref:hypothetical protein n=1 Tax=unclassified Streptacidiphilus TaxID=2643834 RepID=UPI003518B288